MSNVGFGDSESMPAWRIWGEKKEESIVYTVYLKKIKYHTPLKTAFAFYLQLKRMDPDHEYSPSRWSKRGDANYVIQHHIATVTAASDEAKRSVPCSLEVPYGSRKGEKMDIYGLDLPQDAPICVYIHGGYWQDLSRPISAYPVGPLYGVGCVSIVLGYDLAPKVSLEDIVAEIQRGMSKVLEFAWERGAKSVAVAGHSAGAHLAAMLFTDNWISKQGEKAKLLKGVLYISGVYLLEPLLETYVNKVISLDSSSARKLSPLLQLQNSDGNPGIRHMVVVGEHDPTAFKDQSKLFYQRLELQGYSATFQIMPNLDHFDIVEKLIEPDFELSKIFRSLAGR